MESTKSMAHLMSLLAFTFILSTAATAEEEDKVTRIEFERGKSEAEVEAKIVGRESILYKLNARDQQFLQVEMLPGSEADFNVFIPGKGPGDEALFVSTIGGRNYTGQLYKSGDHSILVYLNRAAARRGDEAKFKMRVSITDDNPAEKDQGVVSQKAIDECLAKLRTQIPDREMKVIRTGRGDSLFFVDVAVEGVPKPWRCYHDGTKCTGTEYQGEG